MNTNLNIYYYNIIHNRLPQQMVFGEPPQLARWDDKNAQWRFDGFSDVKYDESTKTIAFKLDHFGPIAFMQVLSCNSRYYNIFVIYL